MATISVRTELGRSANSSDISNDGLFSIDSATVDLQALAGIFRLELLQCLLNRRHREQRMPQFGVHHNILCVHHMRLLGRLHVSFEIAVNHQTIYGLAVALASYVHKPSRPTKDASRKLSDCSIMS